MLKNKKYVTVFFTFIKFNDFLITERLPYKKLAIFKSTGIPEIKRNLFRIS